MAAIDREARRSGTPYLFPDDGGLRPLSNLQAAAEARVEIPAVHLARFDEGVNRTKPVKNPYGWGEDHPLTGLMYCADCDVILFTQFS